MYIIIILIIEGKNQKILTRERDDRDERETKKKQLLAEIRRKQFFYFFEYDWWSMIDWYIEKTHTSGVCPYPKKKLECPNLLTFEPDKKKKWFKFEHILFSFFSTFFLSSPSFTQKFFHNNSLMFGESFPHTHTQFLCSKNYSFHD